MKTVSATTETLPGPRSRHRHLRPLRRPPHRLPHLRPTHAHARRGWRNQPRHLRALLHPRHHRRNLRLRASTPLSPASKPPPTKPSTSPTTSTAKPSSPSPSATSHLPSRLSRLYRLDTSPLTCARVYQIGYEPPGLPPNKLSTESISIAKDKRPVVQARQGYHTPKQ